MGAVAVSIYCLSASDTKKYFHPNTPTNTHTNRQISEGEVLLLLSGNNGQVPTQPIFFSSAPIAPSVDRE